MLVPVLGAHASLLLLAGANVVLGAILLGVAGKRRLAIPSAVVALGVVAWGATRPPLHQVVFNEHFPDQQLLAYWEGLETTVSVGRDADGIQTLFTNSRGQTNDAPDLVRYHRVMGHLAALLAPNRRAARAGGRSGRGRDTGRTRAAQRQPDRHRRAVGERDLGRAVLSRRQRRRAAAAQRASEHRRWAELLAAQSPAVRRR